MDPFVRAQRNAFVSHTIDRVHGQRLDHAWLERTLSDAATRFVVVWHDQVLLNEDGSAHLRYLRFEEIDTLRHQCPSSEIDTVLLGRLGDTVYFGLGIGNSCDPQADGGRRIGQFADLRGAALLLDPEEGALAAQAKAMMHWHLQHRFCGHCGSPMRSEESGYLLRCQNPDCGQVHFPRVDPAIIVLVIDGNRCLLGRQARWPKGRYSNIAGFVEPGESLETAVAREIWEEAGITIRGVAYHSSQPWPFPQSLMVGFTARAATTEIRRNDGELEDARWFTRTSIRDGLVAGTLGLPSRYSISFHLIEDWFDAGEFGALVDLVPDDER